MKRIQIIISFIACAFFAGAQEFLLPDSTLSLADSLMPHYEQSELDILLLEQTLQWMDTTDCQATPDTTTLPDSVYIQRLSSLPYEIEMPYNSIVRSFINMYVVRRPQQVARLRRLSHVYFPLFEDALVRYGLPDELKYLPVIESGLNPSAHSRAGAAGLWQFMPSTGKNCGLEVNSLVDERLDPIRSTDAACRFLKSLYDIYCDWNLVIAAYNCGPGNINKAIRRAGGKRDFWDIYPYLPRETRSYLPIFIAANYALNFADLHGICPATADTTLIADTIMTNRRLHLQQVAALTGVSMQDLRRLNPQYQKDILPGTKDYALRLPQHFTGAFIENEDSIYLYKADSLINNRRKEIDMAQKTSIDGYSVNGVKYYIVQKGDVLGSIAKRNHCTVAQLQKWNNLKGTTIRIGQKLKIMK